MEFKPNLSTSTRVFFVFSNAATTLIYPRSRLVTKHLQDTMPCEPPVNSADQYNEQLMCLLLISCSTTCHFYQPIFSVLLVFLSVPRKPKKLLNRP